MAQPPRYDRNKDFAADYGDNTDGVALNAEYDAAAQSVNAIRDNLAKIQRDDGALRNGIVTVDALDEGLMGDIVNAVSGDIDDKVQQATAAATDAVNASINAANSAANSQNYAEQSLASAGAAQASAQTASSQANSANLSAQAANASKIAAADSADDALVSETLAAIHAANAIDAAADSLSSATAAQLAVDDAAAAAVEAVNAAQTVTEPIAAVVAAYLDQFIPGGQLVSFADIYVPGGFDLGDLSAASPFPNEDAAMRRASLSTGSGVFDFGLLA